MRDGSEAKISLGVLSQAFLEFFLSVVERAPAILAHLTLALPLESPSLQMASAR